MDRINAPAQVVEIRLDGGAWVDITIAVEGFVVPRWRIERKTGVLTSDKVIARVIVPFLEDLGVTVRQVLEAARIDFRLFFHEAMSGATPHTTPVFTGRVIELARLTKLKAGDALDMTALDLIELGNEQQPDPRTNILTSTEPARYDAVAEALAAQMDLTVGSFHGVGLETSVPYITHHPRPGDADATVQIHGLAWWPTHGLLVCGINESIYGYSPSTGVSYELARPPWLVTDPVRQIEELWVDGTDVYGISLPKSTAAVSTPGYIVKADLSGFNPNIAGPPVNYTAYTDKPFKLWNAGQARIKSARAYWAEYLHGETFGRRYCYFGCAIGLGSPEESDMEPGPAVFSTSFETDELTYWYTAFARDFLIENVDTISIIQRASKLPLALGRSVYLPEETAVGLEYTDNDLRPAEVMAYRIPGPLSYYIPRSTPDDDGYFVYDIGNYLPYAEQAGKLPLTLSAGYYSFITHGPSYALEVGEKHPADMVSGFKISFSRLQRRPSSFYTSDGEHLITAEDDVDINTLGAPLGPLLGSGDEFERLYYRDLGTGTRTEVKGFPDGAYLVHLARRSATRGYAVFSREVGLLGAYGRKEPLIRLEIGRLDREGGIWHYSQLKTLGGQPDNYADIEEAIYHYYPTSITYLNNKLYVGYTRTSQHFFSIDDAPVCRAYVNWEGGSGATTQELGNSIIEVNGYLVDDLKAGDRIRLWPDEANGFPYAPLSRTILDVEWVTDDRITKLTVSPTLDCSDGALNPPDRVIQLLGVPGFSHTKGIEEYDTEYGSQFAGGAPTLQKEAEAREVRTAFRAFDLLTSTWGAPIDLGREEATEDLTAEDDPEEYRATLTLSNSFPDTTTIEVKLGDSPVSYTVDTENLYETGECVLGIPRRYAGLELVVTYSYWDISQRFTEATAAGNMVYYTRGKELRSYDGSVHEHGEVHYQASGTTSPLVILPTVPMTVYGVAEGGGNYPYQLSVNHSLHVGDRSGWVGKGLASCLAEVALALGCVFWVDGDGVIHFVPRGWRSGRTDVAPEDILDYREPGAWQRAAPSVTVNWPGGSETAGTLSATRLSDNESVSAPLVTSAGWASLLANHLYTAKGNNASRATVVLAGLRLDIEMGDSLKLPLTGTISPADGCGIVVGIEPELGFGRAATRITLDLED
ncbi:hypothetical protein KAU45_09560 [bacterium]|nr:hypothetical protein [bacterium]